MKLTKRKLWVGVAALVVVIAVPLAVYLNSFFRYQAAVKHITISAVSFSAVPDGVYEGSCDAQFVSAAVRVTVQNGAVTGLELLEHKNERGAPAERVVDDILKKQALPVDAVSGATNSSMVIQQAVQNALNSAGN